MRGRYRKKRENRGKPKKKIWPKVLLALFILYALAALIGTVVIFTKSGELTLLDSFVKFLYDTAVIIAVLVLFVIALVFIDIVGRTTRFLLGDGFGDPGDGLLGGGSGGNGGGGGSFGGGGASR